jgi:nucleotide-binding universal stress UspA family protein
VTGYQRVAVASNFSPTFAAVLAEARCFARHCGATLDVLHAARFDEEKAARFRAALGDDVTIRWAEAESPSAALLGLAPDYELLIAGALHREDGSRPFTNGVARDLLRAAPCDLLLLPRPQDPPAPPAHLAFALDAGDGDANFLRKIVGDLRPARVTLAVAHTPFAAAIAASRGEEPADVEEWLADLARSLQALGVEVEDRVVTSNTGFNLCDVVEGLNADLLVVKAERHGALPAHLNWLHQVIPTRLLVIRERRRERRE